ncbi:MAG: hypothetical protein ACRCXZ_00985 [Patescibacteria group bacterium]
MNTMQNIHEKLDSHVEVEVSFDDSYFSGLVANCTYCITVCDIQLKTCIETCLIHEKEYDKNVLKQKLIEEAVKLLKQIKAESSHVEIFINGEVDKELEDFFVQTIEKEFADYFVKEKLKTKFFEMKNFFAQLRVA